MRKTICLSPTASGPDPICRKPSYAAERRFVALGFHRVRVRVVQGHSGRISSLVLFADEVRRVHPLVHCFLPESYLLGGGVALMQGAAACLMSRRSRNHYQARHPFAAWVESHLHQRMDALVGNSHAVVQDLLDEGAPPERVRLLHNGIDNALYATGQARFARRRAVRTVLKVPEDRVVLTCVANLYPYKGHADLLDALALLGSGFTARTTCLFVGRDAGARASIEMQAERLGLSASVCFLGERGDIPDLLAASDIGVLASYEEGFSNAVIEGMAASLPMVVTDVGGNAEAVIDGECGYVIPPHDPTALAKALENLICDSGRRQNMGEAARRRVAESFSLDACVAAYEALYVELWDCRVTAAHRK